MSALCPPSSKQVVPDYTEGKTDLIPDGNVTCSTTYPAMSHSRDRGVQRLFQRESPAKASSHHFDDLRKLSDAVAEEVHHSASLRTSPAHGLDRVQHMQGTSHRALQGDRPVERLLHPRRARPARDDVTLGDALRLRRRRTSEPPYRLRCRHPHRDACKPSRARPSALPARPFHVPRTHVRL
jgi:hypothetical protein